MPLWHIYTPVDAYSADDKKAFAVALTRRYIEHGEMPKFYVNVLFHEIAAENVLVGGEPRNNFVRLVGTHIARRLPTPESRRWWMQICEEAIAPFVKDRGYDWEMHIDETPLELWQVQGLVPPPEKSEAEKLWLTKNKPVPYEAVET
jgi:phenylpyruvate tautomerase PptA (4-oxalocrotonate tautomerase family)